MKKLIIALLLLGGVATFNAAHAQVNINININSQPEWGPTGYDYAEYYYLPDMDIYYDVPNHRFYYQSGNSWRYSSTLPAQYRNVDLYKTHKVVLKDKNAFLQHNQHQNQYQEFKGKNDQTPIRDSKEDKYAPGKNNWNNNRFKGGNQPNGGGQQGGNKPQGQPQGGGKPQGQQGGGKRN